MLERKKDMSTTYREDCLRHKYAQIPEDNTAPASTKSRKRPTKSKHKHNYQNMVIETDDGYRYLVGICPICGKCTSPVNDHFLKSLDGTRFFSLCWCIGANWNNSENERLWEKLNEHYGHKFVSGFDGSTKFIDLDN